MCAITTIASLKYFLLAGSPVSPDKLRQAVDIFGECMCQSYGQTEVHMIATWLPPQEVAAAARGEHPERLASCGRASYSVRVELMDDEGNILPTGEIGEIVARGGIVGGGYFEMPEATAESVAHGWHHTGDVGRRDADGYYYIVDRKKDMVVSGGFNVYSAAVEGAIMELDAVAEAAGDRHPPRSLGRGGPCRRREGRRDRRSRDHRARQGKTGQCAGAKVGRIRRGDSAHGGRQDGQEGAAPALLGRAGAHGKLAMAN